MSYDRMKTYKWEDYFTEKPCPDGWEAGLILLKKHDGDFDLAVRELSPEWLTWAIRAAHCLDQPSIDLLAKDKDWRVRWEIAYREDLDQPSIDLLAQDKDRSVRLVIAYREDLDQPNIDLLAKDKDGHVREAIEYHINKRRGE